MRTAVLHFALNPVTGVWSVMKILAQAQKRSGRYVAVGIGIIKDQKWPQLCQQELAAMDLPTYTSDTVNWFGTAKFLWQRIQKPPLAQWVQDFAAQTGAGEVILHCHNAWLSGVFQPVTLNRNVKLKFVATFHGVNGHFHRQPVRQTLHRWMAGRLTKHGSLLTSVDQANLSRAKSLLAMNPDDFSVVPNGIEDTNLRGCPRLTGQSVFTLGHVGGMNAAKGWQILVDAAKMLREQGHDIKVVLAGRGEDEALAAKMAEESGGWLQFLGFVPNPQEVVLKNIDALVLMSEQEGLPMAIIEALSMGVPVLATPVGGVPEAVIDGENGFLVERSTGALVEAIRSFLADENRLREMSINARRSFENHFEISRVVSLYDTIYQQKA